jgi:hypothetical protein
MLRAGADGKARTAATGHHGALACAVIVSVRALASLGDVGASWAGVQSLSLARGMYQRDQVSEVNLQDMVR